MECIAVHRSRARLAPFRPTPVSRGVFPAVHALETDLTTETRPGKVGGTGRGAAPTAGGRSNHGRRPTPARSEQPNPTAAQLLAPANDDDDTAFQLPPPPFLFFIVHINTLTFSGPHCACAVRSSCLLRKLNRRWHSPMTKAAAHGTSQLERSTFRQAPPH